MANSSFNKASKDIYRDNNPLSNQLAKFSHGLNVNFTIFDQKLPNLYQVAFDEG